jgi:hypothetical protein
VRPIDPAQTTLDMLCALPGRIRKTDDEAELTSIEEEIDAILRGHLARPADRDESASEAQALIAAAHRLDNLIHHRRMALMVKATMST